MAFNNLFRDGNLSVGKSNYFVDGGIVSERLRERESTLEDVVQNIRVINVASDTIEVAGGETILVENATI